MQTVVNMYSGMETEETSMEEAQRTHSYEKAVEKQKAEGGPRRYYNDGELDVESARVTDENGNPIVKKEQQV